MAANPPSHSSYAPVAHTFNSGSHTPTPVPHHHHHHVHVHTHPHPPQAGPSNRGKEGLVDRKRSRSAVDEALTVAPSEDRHEWYYPAAPRANTFVDPIEENSLRAGVRSGNWNNKLVKGARWVRQGKMAAWGPGHYEWEAEERARKKLRSILPLSPPSSPPLPTLPHLRSPTPPLTAPYTVPIARHKNYTSYVLDPSVQHSFRSTNIMELERTGTELIEGEGALRMALGALWREIEGDSFTANKDQASGRRRSISSGDTPDDEGSVGTFRSGEDPYTQQQSSVHQLFISQESIAIGPEGAQTMLPPQSQIDSFEWCLGVLRELADDGREYQERLEEIREGLGLGRAIQKEVWTISRQKALEEMEIEEEGEGTSDWE